MSDRDTETSIWCFHGNRPSECPHCTLSTDPADDSPSVIGADLPPMPTEAEYKAAFHLAWIARFEELGVPHYVAVAEFESAPWDDIKGMDPALAADTAMEVWDVE